MGNSTGRLRDIVSVASLLTLAACTPDVTRPNPFGHRAATDVILPLESGGLVVNALYAGAEYRTHATDGCPFELFLDRGTTTLFGDKCTVSPQPALGYTTVPPGDWTLTIRFAASPAVVASIPITITAGATTTVDVDVTSRVGLVTGVQTVNGGPPPAGMRLCLGFSFLACKPFPAFSSPPPAPIPNDGHIRFFAPAGPTTVTAGAGFSTLLNIPIVVVAGQTLDLGTINMDLGEVRVRPMYQGQDFEALHTDGCPFRASVPSARTDCPPQSSLVLSNLPAGNYFVGLAWGIGAQPSMFQPATVSAATTTDVPFDLTSQFGIVRGTLVANGQAPSNVMLCVATAGVFSSGGANNGVCKSFPPGGTDGAFAFLVKSGALEYQITGHEFGVLKRVAFTAAAGQTLDLGTVSVASGNLRVVPTYKGQDVASYSTDGCPFWVTTQNPTKLCGDPNQLLLENVTPGARSVSLAWASRLGPALGTQSGTVVAGATTPVTFDVSDHVGIVTGVLTINGAPPSGNITVCLQSPVDANGNQVPGVTGFVCKFYFGSAASPPGDGRFSFFVAPGCGKIAVSFYGVPVRDVRFCNEAGTTLDLGNPFSGNRPPTVTTIGGPYSGSEGNAIHFSATATDPDNDALTYAWTFGDGATGSGAMVSHVYSDNGNYTATLTVTDPRGETASATTSVVVSNVAPSIALAVEATVIQNETFAGSGSFADPGTDTWTASVSYDGGPAGPLALNGKAFSLSHQYRVPGASTLTVHVIDDDGGDGTRSLVVNVLSLAQSVNGVSDYAREHVGSPELRALLGSLDAAAASFDRGNTSSAINQLGACLNKLSAFVGAGKVSAADETILSAKIRRILDAARH